jgi:hypothetical protein
MSKIKFAEIEGISCWTICKDVPKQLLQEYHSDRAMVGSDYCRKKCPHFKRAFKFLFWTVVVCDLKQTDRVTEPYWHEMLR